MVLCWAYGCQHYNRRETCRFYRIPKEPKLWKKWLTLLRRTDTPGKFACVCSCHFRDGRKENLPEIMIFNNHKKFEVHYLTPEKKKRRVRKPASINVPRLNFNNMNEEVTVNTNGEEPMPKQSSTNLHETIGSINTM
ncbi:hypothetical protein FQR65_LT20193 [Abscondita terminalis]|nr:hypothetical protein FQR65_LT20193 [Abscondita terminalis]